MTNLSIGDRVAYQGRAYLVDGFSPMGVTPSLILLRDPVSRRTLELPLTELNDGGDVRRDVDESAA